MFRTFKILAVFCVVLAMGGIEAKADTFGMLTIDFVSISGGSNNPTSGIPAGFGFTFTGVANDYRMGKFEIANDQWNKFKAMYGSVTGFLGQSGYTSPFYAWGTDTSKVPTNNVSWYEAAQFVNYLNTSTGHAAAYKFTGAKGTDNYTFAPWASGDTGYDASNPFRNSKAFYYLPTENEWVKAAYWNGTTKTLQTYATKTNSDPTRGAGTGWNYYDNGYATNPIGPWAVGSGSKELNGTYDMMGNVWERLEGPWITGDYSAGSQRGLRGGSFDDSANSLASCYRGNPYPWDEASFIGFRVASAPEPGSISLLLAGGVALLGYGWRKSLVKRVVSILAVFCVALAMGSVEAKADTFGTGANQFTLEFVPILGGSNNPTSGISAGTGFTFTGVANDYRMGKFEITNDQWNKFTASVGGTVTGNATAAYDSPFYAWGTNTTSVPTNCTSWYEAAQFVNYLNTCTGHTAAYKFIGEQGTSSYTFAPWSVAEAAGGTNLYRHKDAFYYLPTENEWVKAAYWNGTSLQTYATKAGESLTQGNGTSGTGWNYSISTSGYATSPYGPWAVGSGSQELNGTYDMMGNTWEWTDSPYMSSDYIASLLRAFRGGSFRSYANFLASSDCHCFGPTIEDIGIGFRVASVPEPGSIALLLVAGCVALLGYGWRKRR